MHKRKGNVVWLKFQSEAFAFLCQQTDHVIESKKYVSCHLQQMKCNNRPPCRRRLTIDPHQSRKEKTHMKCSCRHFLSEMVNFHHSQIVYYTDDGLCLFALATSATLVFTNCFQPLPLGIKVQALLLYECLCLLPHFRCLTYNPDIFFSTAVFGKTLAKA